jgi:hypothetical protein
MSVSASNLIVETLALMLEGSVEKQHLTQNDIRIERFPTRRLIPSYNPAVLQS